MKEISKEDVLKRIEINILKNKEISNNVAKTAIEDILNKDKGLQKKINDKFYKKEELKDER